MNRIEINTRKSIRFGQLGDWFRNGAGTDCIEVQEMGNEDEEFLIALHEFCEWYLCKKAGVTQESVDEFDKNFKGEGEPGDDKAAPYYRQHAYATMIEALMCKELGLDWDEYLSRTNGFTTSEGVSK